MRPAGARRPICSPAMRRGGSPRISPSYRDSSPLSEGGRQPVDAAETVAELNMNIPFEEKPPRLNSPLPPGSKQCICPGKDVPLYCPLHGAVENTDWPLLKPLAAVLNAVKDEEVRVIAITLSEETSPE
jgi:hypothetical protein